MAYDVPRQPELPPVWQRQITQKQDSVRLGTFNLSNLPGYEPGVPPAVETWHDIDFLDIYPKIYGSEFGANGIGRLPEVALTGIAENERFTPYSCDAVGRRRLAISPSDPLATANNAATVGTTDECFVIKHDDCICVSETRIESCSSLNFMSTRGKFGRPSFGCMPFYLNRR